MDTKIVTINIISKQVDRSRTTGPKKVLLNLCKGIDAIGVKYVFNEPISKHDYNWIHDDQIALIEAGFIGKPVVVGPNLAVLPLDLPIFRKKLPEGSVYLHPSQWTIDIWNFLGYNEARLEAWPVGIDTEEFSCMDRSDKNKILLYFKQRDISLLEQAKAVLEKIGLEYIVIHYGFYAENEYKTALRECRFGIWIGCSESQGIGLQEAMATGMPLIILDSTTIFDAVTTSAKRHIGYCFPKKLKEIKTTSAPYFDESCGIVICDITLLESSILCMLNMCEKYDPRKYVIDNLSLKRSAEHLLSLFESIDKKEVDGYNWLYLSRCMFYCGLFFQKWAWNWVYKKIIGIV